MPDTIQWRDWDSTVFKTSAQSNKPILLKITAVWCHWCHVMDQTTYSNPQVIEAINKGFIPVKVYVDKRPDIVDRYNAGGFPTTALLDHNGNVLYNATYLPPEQMRHFLHTGKQEFEKRGSSSPPVPVPARSQPASVSSSELPITKEMVLGIGKAFITHFDPTYGGFGMQPKFPFPEAISLSLSLYHLYPEPLYREIALQTLKHQQHIYDTVEGGLFRYAVQQDWSEPHYEKMLDTNAAGIRNYAEAYAFSGDVSHRETAEGIFNYLSATLFDSSHHYFYGSQDADEKYYPLSREQRSTEKAPYVDPTLYTAANALTVSSLLHAAPLIENIKMQEMALSVLDSISDKMIDSGKGVFHYRENGNAHSPGFLHDHALLLTALLDGYSTTFNEKYLSSAEQLVEHTGSLLWDGEAGAFRDSIGRAGEGHLSVPLYQLSDNTLMADALLQWASITDESRYHQQAEQVLRTFVPKVPRYGMQAAPWGLAALSLLEPFTVKVYGKPGDNATAALLQEAHSLYHPLKKVLPFSVEKNSEMERRFNENGPFAVVCKHNTCSPTLFTKKAILDFIK